MTTVGTNGTGRTFSTDDGPTVDVAMLGARNHYAVPKLLHRERLLGTFFTDVFLPTGGLLHRTLTAARRIVPSDSLHRWVQRTDMELDNANVQAFHDFGIRYAMACRKAGGAEERNRLYLQGAREFSRQILRHGVSPCQALYVFDCAAEELMAQTRTSGRRFLLEQTIAPKATVARMLQEEAELWPGWEPRTNNTSLEVMAQCERSEWEMADLILAPSRFVFDSLIEMGVPNEKCRLVPYAVSLEQYPARPPRTPPQGKLRVLFAGSVELRKGAIYLLEALRRLHSDSIRAKFAGSVALDGGKLRQYERWAEFIGPVSRSDMNNLYDWSDVFVFPSVCEGSALVTYEALAKGIPVIGTPNAGSVVEHGVDGLIVPVRKADALADVIDMLASDRRLLAHMARNAAGRRARLGLESYQKRLRDCVLEVCSA